MRLFAFAALFFVITPALAEDAPVPLPRPRPPEVKVPLPVEVDRLEREAALKICEEFTRADVAVSTSLAPMAWDNGCTAAAPVSVTAIKLEGGKLVEVRPAATLRCPTALIVARWFREDLEPLAERLGSPITRIEVASSFACRPRNSVVGAIMSEHGKANALDIWALQLADGRRIGIEHADGPREFLSGMRQSACARFTTVLGPGADKDHETHLHVDLAERRHGYRICQWTLPEGDKAEPGATGVAAGKKAEKER